MQAIEVDCGPVTQDLRLAVYARDRGYCRYCYRFMEPEHPYHADHVRPRAFGGPTALTNLVLACPPCNTQKGDEMWAPLPIFGDAAGDFSAETVREIKRRRKARPLPRRGMLVPVPNMPTAR